MYIWHHALGFCDVMLFEEPRTHIHGPRCVLGTCSRHLLVHCSSVTLQIIQRKRCQRNKTLSTRPHNYTQYGPNKTYICTVV